MAEERFPQFVGAIKTLIIERSTLRRLPDAITPKIYAWDAPHAVWLCNQLQNTQDTLDQGIIIGQLIAIMVGRGYGRTIAEWEELVFADRNN